MILHTSYTSRSSCPQARRSPCPGLLPSPLLFPQDSLHKNDPRSSRGVRERDYLKPLLVDTLINLGEAGSQAYKGNEQFLRQNNLFSPCTQDPEKTKLFKRGLEAFSRDGEKSEEFQFSGLFHFSLMIRVYLRTRWSSKWKNDFGKP
jgi:hypothetical protein